MTTQNLLKHETTDSPLTDGKGHQPQGGHYKPKSLQLQLILN